MTFQLAASKYYRFWSLFAPRATSLWAFPNCSPWSSVTKPLCLWFCWSLRCEQYEWIDQRGREWSEWCRLNENCAIRFSFINRAGWESLFFQKIAQFLVFSTIQKSWAREAVTTTISISAPPFLNWIASKEACANLSQPSTLVDVMATVVDALQAPATAGNSLSRNQHAKMKHNNFMWNCSGIYEFSEDKPDTLASIWHAGRQTQGGHSPSSVCFSTQCWCDTSNQNQFSTICITFAGLGEWRGWCHDRSVHVNWFLKRPSTLEKWLRKIYFDTCLLFFLCCDIQNGTHAVAPEGFSFRNEACLLFQAWAFFSIFLRDFLQILFNRPGVFKTSPWIFNSKYFVHLLWLGRLPFEMTFQSSMWCSAIWCDDDYCTVISRNKSLNEKGQTEDEEHDEKNR